MFRPLLVAAVGCLAVGCGSSRSTVGSTTSAAVSSTSGTSVGSSTPAPTTSTPPQPAAFQLVSWETVDQGVQSPRGQTLGAHELQVASDADWRAFWPTHSAQPAPSVDFAQRSVVGSFMALTPGSTNHTSVLWVERDANSDDLRVLVREHRLGPWAASTVRVTTAPFHLVSVDTPVSGQGTLAVERQALLDMEVLRAGSDNLLGVNDPAYPGELRVFRDAAAFDAFYVQVVPGGPLPAVDFQQEMVVAVLGPHIPRFGNSVETQRIVHDPAADELRVISRVLPYRGGAAPPPAIEAPYQFLRVPRASGTIRAEVEQQAPLVDRSSGLARGFAGAAAETLVVRDPARFATLWAARIGGTPPAVDFSQDQVLLAFEPAGSPRQATIAGATLLEDHELAVRVETTALGVTRDPRYSVALTPRTFGPVGFQAVDVTPRP